MKFNTGDRVVYSNPDYGYSHSRNGKAGVVVACSDDFTAVRFDDRGHDLSMYTKYLTLEEAPLKTKFEVGDTVKGKHTGRLGKIKSVRPLPNFRGQRYSVRWIDAACDTEESEGVLLMPPVEEPPIAPAAPFLGSIMKLLRDRKWETSYTKTVVDGLEKVLPYWCKQVGNPVHDAVQLLIQYHRDLHIPYDQRDSARLDAKIWKNTADSLRRELDEKTKAAPAPTFKWDIYAGEGKSTRRADVIRDLKMAQGIAQYDRRYGSVGAIEAAITELERIK